MALKQTMYKIKSLEILVRKQDQYAAILYVTSLRPQTGGRDTSAHLDTM